jgi:hypothetical protein
MKDRANTREEKRATLERLYEIWCAMPEQRLGQLLINAYSEVPSPMSLNGWLWNVEDSDAIAAVVASGRKQGALP